MKDLEIIIVGKAAHGKSTAAVMIQALLSNYGAKVTVKDDEPITSNQRRTLAVNADRILRDTKITITTKQRAREINLPKGFHQGEPAVFKETPKKQ